jgi:hypothetical protein
MITYSESELFTRSNNIQSTTVAFGCSHTWGVGVEQQQTWSHQLQAHNFGQGACSVDFIVRNAPMVLEKINPGTVYVLWPDWSRFEIVKNNIIYQSLPTDHDRIYYMEQHNETWLRENFRQKTSGFRNWCKEKNIYLVDITLYNLIPYIDHADKWPLSSLGHHYGPQWHQWVADIFYQLKLNNTALELAYD